MRECNILECGRQTVLTANYFCFLINRIVIEIQFSICEQLSGPLKPSEHQADHQSSGFKGNHYAKSSWCVTYPSSAGLLHITPDEELQNYSFITPAVTSQNKTQLTLNHTRVLLYKYFCKYYFITSFFKEVDCFLNLCYNKRAYIIIEINKIFTKLYIWCIINALLFVSL